MTQVAPGALGRPEERRPVIDVSRLPTTVFGHRGPVWWATVAFMAIEGTTLGVAGAAYFYLMRHFPEWPPRPTPLPELGVATVNLVVILAAIVPMRLAAARAREFDLRGIQSWMWLAVALGAVATVLRAFEFDAVNARWDEHVYGSLLWVILGLHSTLLLIDVLETATIAAILRTEHRQDKHFADVQDAALYQYFLSLTWVPLYVLVYLVPRL